MAYDGTVRDNDVDDITKKLENPAYLDFLVGSIGNPSARDPTGTEKSRAIPNSSAPARSYPLDGELKALELCVASSSKPATDCSLAYDRFMRAAYPYALNILLPIMVNRCESVIFTLNFLLDPKFMRQKVYKHIISFFWSRKELFSGFLDANFYDI
jgi:hypothetical protein